jgi:DhnA family fructose-bisphosphate aldolase class Ia
MRLPAHRPDVTETAMVEEVISEAPPVLLAGGPPDGSLETMLRMAYDLGLSGTCIGRHYFTAALCAQTSKATAAAFGDRE